MFDLKKKGKEKKTVKNCNGDYLNTPGNVFVSALKKHYSYVNRSSLSFLKTVDGISQSFSLTTKIPIRSSYDFVPNI